MKKWNFKKREYEPWGLSGWCGGLPINGDDATYLKMKADDFCSYGERK